MTQVPEGQITDEALERLRSRLGTYNRPSFYGVGQFNEYATVDTIRHFVQGIGDENPLWLDHEYARSTRYGEIIAPPNFLYSVYWCSGRTGGLPGVHGFHAGNDWVWYRPIRLGDRITVQEQFTGLDEKKGEFAGRIFVQSSLATYRDQRGELLAECKGWMIRAERRAARERGKYQRETYRYSSEELAAIEEAVLNEEIRGSNPRFWEDVQVGDECSPIVKGPMSTGDIAAFVAGAIGGLAHGASLKEFRKHPAWGFRGKSGALEAIIRVHDAEETAAAAGLPLAYDYGCQRMSWLCQIPTNWMGDDGSLRRLHGRLHRFNYVGDTTWLKGKVSAKREENGEYLADLDIWAENQMQETTASGNATVALPSRTGSPWLRTLR